MEDSGKGGICEEGCWDSKMSAAKDCLKEWLNAAQAVAAAAPAGNSRNSTSERELLFSMALDFRRSLFGKTNKAKNSSKYSKNECFFFQISNTT